MRTIKLYAGMTGEFEILRSDAPDSVIIQYIQACNTDILPENDPDLFFSLSGYFVQFLACQYDDCEEIEIDIEFDTYNY